MGAMNDVRRRAGLLPPYRVARIAVAFGLWSVVAACGDAGATRGSNSLGALASTTLGDPDEAWVESTLAGLSLERKVAQLLAPDIVGGYLADDDPRVLQWERLARDYGVGMFVFYGGTPRDVAHRLNRLQQVAEIPILMAADFEGGPGQQVVGASEYPANMAFAAVGDEDLMYRAAAAAAVEGRAMGIHLTYTPVVDIAWRPENPAESVRSFGGDLDLLGRMVHAYVRGYHANGMLTTAKHFPGRGDVEAMPGNAPWQWNPKSAEDMAAQELTAFKQGIDAGVDFVMSEHIAVPSLTGGSELPASVEPALATGVLREQLGFTGILTTDDLWYEHVVKRFGAEEVALRAFEAGHDIILKPTDPVATIEALTNAVRSGRIPEERLDASVRRLLRAKSRLGLQRGRFVDEDAVGERVATAEHRAIVREVADRSLTMLRNDGLLPVDPARLADAVNISVQKLDADLSPPQIAAKLSEAFPGIRNFMLRPGQSAAVREEIFRAAAGADVVILSLFVPRDRLGAATPIRAVDRELIGRIATARRGRVVAMAYGNPHLIRALPEVSAFLVGYGERSWFGNQEVYFDSFIAALTGELSPGGKLPVYVSDEYPIGFGMSF
jgi:beta-N-acetylhexosaminidase